MAALLPSGAGNVAPEARRANRRVIRVATSPVALLTSRGYPSLLPLGLHMAIDGCRECQDPPGDLVDVVNELGTALRVRMQAHGLVGRLISKAVAPPVLGGNVPPRLRAQADETAPSGEPPHARPRAP